MDVNLKLSITNEKTITAEDIIAEADNIWREVKAAKVSITDESGIESLMKTLRAKHPEFAQSYPIVLRYLCQMQEYDTRALRRWLKKIEINPWKTEAAYLEAQADYVAILYRTKHPRAPASNTHAIRTNIRAMLEEEHGTFKKYADIFHRQIEEEEQMWNEKNKTELAEFISAADMTRAGTVRCEVGETLSINRSRPTLLSLLPLNAQSTPQQPTGNLGELLA